MMGKLPLGTTSPYVKMSSGGCTDPLNFYATSYCTAYGREKFKPRMGSHVGTGYKSNLRPFVSYQPSLDALDNPGLGEQVWDTFQSVTSKSYRPLQGPDGRDALPWSMYQTCSGYGREKSGLEPFTREVKKVHFDTQEHGPQAVAGLEPKATPLLLQLQHKGSPEWENVRYGPRFMTSEYNSKYLEEPPAQQDLLQKKSIGAKERTGFTEGSATGPLDLQPACQALPADPAFLPGGSVTKADFLPMTNPQGSEFLPALAQGSERETGYSRMHERTMKLRGPSRPWPWQLSPPSALPSSTTHEHFRPPRPVQQTSVALLGRQAVGAKAPTGFSLNNTSSVCSPPDPAQDSRYLTSCSQGFSENLPKGLDWEGWTQGGVQPLKPSGYALNQGPRAWSWALAPPGASGAHTPTREGSAMLPEPRPPQTLRRCPPGAAAAPHPSEAVPR